MDDSKIVELYLSRDESAVSHTAGKYGSKLRTIANRILDDPASAEECENDTYLAAWGLIPPNEPRTYLFSFLSKITRHIALDMIRKRNSSKRSAVFCELTDEMQECLPGASSVTQEIDAKELTQLINEFLESCTEEQRNIFVRRYWYFDSVAEICAKYSLPQSRVKTTLFRMREKLKKRLTDGGFTA